MNRKGMGAALVVVAIIAAGAAAGSPVSAAETAPLARISLDGDWTFRHAHRDKVYPAEVPGVVHLDLLRNQLIAEPFYGTHERDLQWIGKADWEYRKTFSVDAEILKRRQQELVFEGLDTYAEVYLNGELLLEADNMYRWWRVPVAGKLTAGDNELRVVFRSPIVKDLERVERHGYELPAANDKAEKTSPYTRKAPYNFGWDWGPRFVTSGIWKPVRLEAWDRARLVDVFVRQVELGEERARLEADVEVVRGDKGRRAALEVLVDGTAVARSEFRLEPGAQTHTLAFEIEDPKLWWPNGLGEQALYRVETRLSIGGQVIDESSTRIGLRTIELRREKDEWGRSFEFVVNGVPVFAKGANWIPADSFLTRVTRERYEDLLGSAKRANMNMIRVWAGGIYENDDFFDVADELGLLVWEDFHFSTSLYPADQAFLANVAIEAEQNIRRLRNHPSLAVWCGNNEVEVAWHFWGWKRRLPQWLFDDYEKLFRELLPDVVAEHDPTRPYVSSSPSAEGEALPGSAEIGDMHYWGVWHAAEPFEAYERNPTRFMSEYGFQSFPELKTIKTFAPDDQMAIDSEVMLSHQKHPRGNQLIREYMLRDYPEPKDFGSFLYLSQVLQAEGMKVGAEYLRRSRPRTMGSLYWQLNDCWPVASWSGLDYYGRWKAFHYHAKRFYSDVLVSTAEEDGAIGVYVVSDRTEPFEAVLEARLLDLDGETLWSERRDLTVEPLASRRELGVEKAELLEGLDPAAVFLHVRASSDGEEVSSNRRFFAPPKELELRRPRIEVEVAADVDVFAVTLSSDTLAPNVRLTYEPDDGFFTDNYFDLVPGSALEVRFEPQGEVTLEDFREGLVIESIFDAFGPEVDEEETG